MDTWANTRMLAMRRMSWLLVVAVIGVSVTTAPTLAASLITNGSFEDPPMTSGIDSLALGSTYLTGWTVFQGNIERVSPGYWPAADGIASLDLNGVGAAGGVEQAIATIAGYPYRVTFSLWANFAHCQFTSCAMRVQADGDESQDFPVVLTGWVTRTLDFIANDSSTLLQFSDITPDATSWAGGPALDQVSAVELTAPSAVPAPTSLLLLGAALLTMAALARRRAA